MRITPNYRAACLKELEEEKNRLKELQEKGADALSRYDIDVAAGGDAKEALETALYLTKNHILYAEKQIGGQKTLYEVEENDETRTNENEPTSPNPTTTTNGSQPASPN